jgi:hypothetical protein
MKKIEEKGGRGLAVCKREETKNIQLNWAEILKFLKVWTLDLIVKNNLKID